MLINAFNFSWSSFLLSAMLRKKGFLKMILMALSWLEEETLYWDLVWILVSKKNLALLLFLPPNWGFWMAFKKNLAISY